ncbi:MAG TPA: hypothetical protein VIM89_11315 [Mucilaginibacter sp.]
MKKLFAAAIAVTLLMPLAKAQSCSDFINASNGEKLVYSNMDAKGKEIGQITYTSTKKDNSTVGYHTEMTDKNGKSMGASDSEIKCSGDALRIDMKSFVPPSSAKQLEKMQVSGEAKYLVYPLNVKVGQTLEDGTMTMNITNNGSPMGDMQMDITNRKVEQAETLSIPAGSFDCFRISYDAMVRVKMMGIGFPIHMHVVEWFSPKVARPVKSETYTKNGKLAGTMQLVSIN